MIDRTPSKGCGYIVTQTSSQIGLGVLFLLLTLIGVLFNGLSSFILAQGVKVIDRGAKKRIHRLYLAVTDLVGALALPAITFIQTTQLSEFDNGAPSVCHLVIRISAEFIRFSSVLHQLTVAITVYISTVHPLKYLIYSPSQKKKFGALVWFLALCLSFDPFDIWLIGELGSTRNANRSSAHSLLMKRAEWLLAESIFYPIKYFIPTCLVIVLSVITTIRVKAGRRNLERQCHIYGRKSPLWVSHKDQADQRDMYCVGLGGGIEKRSLRQPQTEWSSWRLLTPPNSPFYNNFPTKQDWNS